MNYGNTVFANIPKYLLRRLQKVQNITAGYVLSRYASIEDVINLKWLSVKNLVQWNTVKLVHKSKFDPNYPTYLKINFHCPRRNLRSSFQVETGESNTFQQQAKEFDKLPENIRKIQEYKIFCNK